MKCWKDDCLEESTIFCMCLERIYSCKEHILNHLKFNRKARHQVEALSLKPNPGTKQVLYDYLRRRNTELIKFQAKVIDGVSKKIKQLKSQLQTAIDEIERVKKENSILIDRIIQVKRISENDDLGKFLDLEPNAAMRKIQNEICRIDVEKIPDYIECEGDICDCSMKGDEICIFRDNTKKLLRYNLMDQTGKEAEIPIELNTSTWLSMCKLPNGNLFCFGGYPNYTSTVFMIYPDNNIEDLESFPQPIGAASAIYYKNEVYAFGGSNANVLVLTPKKYNIKENKWKPLPNLSVGANCCTGFGYKNKIFFAGDSHTKIYIYDIQTNSYSEMPIALNVSGKILFLNRSTFYVIGANSCIYEFDANNYEWKGLGSCAVIDIRPVSHFVEFNKCFYFMDNKSCLNKFDLKSIEKKRV